MKKYIFSSDFHIGLFTDELDRTNEIISIVTDIVNHAVSIKADGVIFGGDIFHNNNPSSYLIKRFLKIINILNKNGIKIWIIDGNHDKISNEKISCLQFLKELKSGYKVKLISDIKCLRIFKSEIGNCYFTFLPHISTNQIPDEFKTVQKYIDAKTKRIQESISINANHFIFSHLNVKEAIPGTEQFMLKRSEAYLPEPILNPEFKHSRPIIIQAHIHTQQVIDRIHIIGSPIFVDFGEKEKKKYFCEINIPEYLGEGRHRIKMISTRCRPLKEFNIDCSKTKLEKKQIRILCKKISKRSILKVNLTIPDHKILNLSEISNQFKKYCYHLKPIKPRIVRKVVKRNRHQTIKLSPNKAVKVWIKKHNPKNAVRISELVESYIESVL